MKRIQMRCLENGISMPAQITVAHVIRQNQNDVRRRSMKLNQA
jgi:hypothetical protein